MLTFVWFFLALSFLVLIHEFGHFIMAKSFNVYVHEFSIFMGPVLFQKQKGETKYSLRLLPIGGYCSMAGELDMQAEGQDDEGLNIPPERTLVGINRFKQFLISVAGPLMNILIALILMMICFMGIGEDKGHLKVEEGSIMAEAGLKTGDHIDYMESRIINPNNGDEIFLEVPKSNLLNTYVDLAQYLDTTIIKVVGEGKDKEQIFPKAGFVQELKLYVNGETTPKVVTRTFDKVEVTDNGLKIEPLLGIGINRDDVSFGRSIVLSAQYNAMMGTEIFRAVGQLFTRDGFNNVSGIVGMYKVANDVTSMGIWSILNFIAMISINLGILNLLPFPGLDGGRILIIIGESITRKKLPAKVESFINNLGFLLLLGLIIAVTIKDIFFMNVIVKPIFKSLL